MGAYIVQDEDVIPISALQHYLYCPRQFGLIHVEGIWTENVQTAQGRVLHKRADLPGASSRNGVRTITAMPLRHEKLRLAGIADVVEMRAGEDGKDVPYPVEYKRGRPKPHRADEVQLCAQALCLEEMFGVSLQEGALFYGVTRHRMKVPLDRELRELTISAVREVTSILSAGITPRAVYEPKRCDACSLIDDCHPRLLSRGKSVSKWVADQISSIE